MRKKAKDKTSNEEMKKLVEQIDHIGLKKIKETISPSGRNYTDILAKFIEAETGRKLSTAYIRVAMHHTRKEPFVVYNAILCAAKIEQKSMENIDTVRMYMGINA